jgi:acylphosphatase
MKKATRLYITGNLQSMFYKLFIKENADKLGVRGFLRILEDGRVDIFLEGDSENVNVMSDICRKGPKYAQIRSVEQKEERLQDFKDFKILKF